MITEKERMDEAIRLCHAFLDLIDSPGAAEFDDIRSLYRLSDEISVLAHGITIPRGDWPDGPSDSDENSNPPEEIERRFAKLDGDVSIEGSDPWLDLSEIASDLRRIIMLYESGH